MVPPSSVEAAAPSLAGPPSAPHVPGYLDKTYWWAYVHPKAVHFFEREWLVNLILFGNYGRLRDAALDDLGETVHGRSLQVACAYGNITPRLHSRLAPDATLDVVVMAALAADAVGDARVKDLAPRALVSQELPEPARKKLAKHAP